MRRDVALPEWMERLSRAFAEPDQPQAAYQAFDRLCADAFGHKLFTLLTWRAGADEVKRVYSSRPAEYPISARKRMGPTAWGTRVLREGRAWLGSGPSDMRWAFPDHDLIASLGCADCLNAPVRWDGAVLGAINVLDSEGAYSEADLQALEAVSGLLVAPLLAARSLPSPPSSGR